MCKVSRCHICRNVTQIYVNAAVTEIGCNCRQQAKWVLNRKCLTESLVYESKVKMQQDTKEYIGLTSNTFKTRYYAHSSSFNAPQRAHNTALSTHIWKLKENNISCTMEWSIMKLAPAYNRKVRTCQLCLMEKTLISLADTKCTLNKRNEIISKCRNRDKVLLKHW